MDRQAQCNGMLSLADIHHLEAAEGWLERKQYADCFRELDRIDPNHRGDARELTLWWKLYNATSQWSAAANLALRIQRRFPNDLAAYLWRSMALAKLGFSESAYNNLKPVAFEFTNTGLAPFFLAQYACDLGNFTEAREWLAIAFEAPDAEHLKAHAQHEPRLEKLWRTVGQL
jgi:tetratricopeptide (TPR) repeat protein